MHIRAISRCHSAGNQMMCLLQALRNTQTAMRKIRVRPDLQNTILVLALLLLECQPAVARLPTHLLFVKYFLPR